MKVNVKVDSDIVDKVRKRIKKTKQTLGGYVEMAIHESFSPTKCEIGDNSDAFHAYLDGRGIKYRPNGSFTTVFWDNPFDLGKAWGLYNATNNPAFKSIGRPAKEFTDKM